MRAPGDRFLKATGNRIWLSLVLDLLAGGMSAEQLLREYPQLEEADLLACIAYGAEMARERCVEIPTETGR
ncbi:MAG: DUF433 domain-containing protein [Phycisphaerales bacterium]|nr:MAG: DUF433 domain-containing protein [Phycisphaerales bacterium]